MPTAEKPVFNKEKYTILLPIHSGEVDVSDIEETLVKKGFARKEEFHATIVGFAAGAKLAALASQDPSLVDSFEELIEETDWSFDFDADRYAIAKEYKFSDGRTERRQSVVQSVSIPGLASFYESLNGIFGTSLEAPPAHVTLFTKGNPMGIGIATVADFQSMNPVPIAEFLSVSGTKGISSIVLPVRCQADTLVAIFILKKFGEGMFPGISDATVEFLESLPKDATPEGFEAQGTLLMDVGGGRFDHHGKGEVTATDLVIDALNLRGDQSLAKLLEYARRDDLQGAGTISKDSLDRAFGLSGLITVLNKKYAKTPAVVVDIVFPLLEAHHDEEVRRTSEMPKEVEGKLKAGKAEVFAVRQRGKNLSVFMIESDNPSLPGYLRSQLGGKHDVVVQWLPSGHANILTRPAKQVDLRALAVMLRMEESTIAGTDLGTDPSRLAVSGRMPEIPEWYYDPATNSLQNGGINPKEVKPTKIEKFTFRKLLEVGLSESLWSPHHR